MLTSFEGSPKARKMGNDPSKPSSRMATSALAHIMRITKQQLLTLRDTCLSVSQTGCDVQTASGYRLSRAKFLDAMTATNVNLEPDYQILEKLFVMWDMEGAGIDPVSS